MRDNAQYPRARLDLYEEAVVLTRYEGGGRHTSYPVAVDDVVAAFSRVPVSSGLLPKNCLFWGGRTARCRWPSTCPAGGDTL